MWGDFKDAIIEAQKCLLLVQDKEYGDWVADDLCDVSRRKQKAWMEWEAR